MKLSGVRIVSRNAFRTVGERRLRRGRLGKSCGTTVGAPGAINRHPHSSVIAFARVDAFRGDRYHFTSFLIPIASFTHRTPSHASSSSPISLDKPRHRVGAHRSRRRAPSGFLGGTRVVGGAMVLSARALTRVRGACGFTKALGVVMVVESIVSSCAVASPATVCAYEDLEIASRRGFYGFSEERKRERASARVNGERIVKK